MYFATQQVMKGEAWDGSEKSGSKIKQWFGAWMFATRTKDIDVMTGKQEMDALESMDVPPVPRNWLEKFWFWLA